MSPDDPLAQRLATMACTGFEIGGSDDEVARDVRLLWEHLGSPAGAFDAAARAVAALPQRPEVPLADMPRRKAMEREFGIQPVEVELAAALSARELLERLAGMRGIPGSH
ncbi:hypothetical protein [Curtobacterium sp. Leaf261]|uniref:hypothetical protein n=1 Tax=Curtobacterium sp. Leaf261 TaxID=1736311 RepID=UPI0006F57A64|nr:hypothetical protein [Curtobacterium sp. Leaf261]KQO59730.1 hypothetical protein ASF23_15670 [Curtobacterium sp. Leaf261]